MHAHESLSSLSVEALTARIAQSLEQERSSIVELVFLLVELSRRGSHLELGYDSLFTYCVEGLGLERSSAYRRSTAAELIARFPAIGPHFAERRISLSALVPLKRILTAENHLEVLSSALGRTEEEVERLVAAHEARPVPRDVVRRLAPRLVAASELAVASNPPPNPAAEEPLFALPPPRTKVEPVNGEWTRIAFSVGNEFMDEFQQTKAALSHVVPDGSFEAVFRECMRLAREASMRRRLGATGDSFGPKLAGEAVPAPAPELIDESSASFGPELTHGEAALLEPTDEGLASFGSELTHGEAARPEPSDEELASFGPKLGEPEPSSFGPKLGRVRRSRYIPVPVRRAVWERDGGCCSWVGPTGRRCGSRHRLEFDHWDPFALGGEGTVENVRLLCHSHNQHWARVVFGAEHQARFVGQPATSNERG